MQMYLIMIFLIVIANNIYAQDNTILKKLYEDDQNARNSDSINWIDLSKQDSLRRVTVSNMLKQNLLSTSNDYYHAAMIYQHGKDSVSYKLAWDYSLKAFNLDTTNQNARWLTAASHDRYLLSVGKSQIYGTQFIILDKKYYLQEIDTTKVTDAERRYFNTRTLLEIKEFLTKKNGEDKGLLIFPKQNKVIVK